jgi:hypothetical protein
MNIRKKIKVIKRFLSFIIGFEGNYFSSDRSRMHALFLRKHRKNKSRALIFGSAPNLKEVKLADLGNIAKDTLTLSSNLTYKRVKTDIVVYSDDHAREKITDIDLFPGRSLIIKLEYYKQNFGFKGNIDLWADTKNFSFSSGNGIFIMRNSLVGMLHYCYLCNIKKICLAGVQLDSLSHFYDPKENIRAYKRVKKEVKLGGDVSHLPYEQLPPERTYRQYTVYKAANEVITYLVEKEGFDISYIGKSDFLESIGLLTKVASIADWNNI